MTIYFTIYDNLTYNILNVIRAYNTIHTILIIYILFEVRAYQYKVLPFGLSLSPCVFMKVAEAALVLLRVRILNYLDDGSHTGSVSASVMRTQGFGALAPQPVGPSGQLGKE